MKLTYLAIGNILMNMGALFFAIDLLMPFALDDMGKLNSSR